MPVDSLQDLGVLIDMLFLYCNLSLLLAYQHCSDDDSTTRPLYLVTASVDKIMLKKPIRVDADLKIAGAVTWVGRSSIKIQLDVTQPATGTFFKTCTAIGLK